MSYFKKTPEFEKMEDLSKKVPAPLSWIIPDPYSISSYIMPITGLTKMQALSKLAQKAGKSGYLTTSRIGDPKGTAGTFFGTEIPKTVGKETVEVSLPTRGKDVAVFLMHEVEGLQSSAPLADAVSYTKNITVPKKLFTKLKNYDNLDSTWAEDLVGALSLKLKGYNYVHFINPETAKTVSVDLSQHTTKELMTTLKKMLVKKGTGEPFYFDSWNIK